MTPRHERVSFRARLAEVRRRVAATVALPERAPLPPMPLTVRLGAFLSGLWAIAIGALVVGLALAQPPDWWGALLAGVLIGAVSVWSVPSAARIQGRWSAGVFFELAFAFTIGPLAVITMAVGHAAGDYLRRRPAPVRTAFNAANHILADLVAWATFSALAGGHPPLARALGAGVVGGLAQLVVGMGFVGVILGLATDDFRPRELIRALLQLLPWNIAFGFAAGGVYALYGIGGPLGLLVLLVPVVMLQMSLVATARRMAAEAEKDAAHAREREALLRREAQALRRAGDASEIERKRIAADLHDSVIQDVSGLLFRSSALLGRLSDGDPAVFSREGVEDYLSYTHDLATEAVRELRTLMVELAPPLLDQEGLSSALRQLLTRLDREQISWVLECEEKNLEPRHQRLVYRVVQEALRNVVQHSQCHNVWVTVRTEADRLVATIRDDGRGFTAAERAASRKRGHAGLGLLVQTARDGGGELAITSARGKGTTLELSVPLLPTVTLDEVEAGETAEASTSDTFLVGEGAVTALGAGQRAPAASAGRPRGRRPRGQRPVTSTSLP